MGAAAGLSHLGRSVRGDALAVCFGSSSAAASGPLQSLAVSGWLLLSSVQAPSFAPCADRGQLAGHGVCFPGCMNGVVAGTVIRLHRQALRQHVSDGRRCQGLRLPVPGRLGSRAVELASTHCCIAAEQQRYFHRFAANQGRPGRCYYASIFIESRGAAGACSSHDMSRTVVGDIFALRPSRPGLSQLSPFFTLRDAAARGS